MSSTYECVLLKQLLSKLRKLYGSHGDFPASFTAIDMLPERSSNDLVSEAYANYPYLILIEDLFDIFDKPDCPR